MKKDDFIVCNGPVRCLRQCNRCRQVEEQEFKDEWFIEKDSND